ncbi:MAG: murein biosynthesis integral membrane protein MurJ [Patescibacteria group bacterium]|jgi:putative peptidoglycan lipid II flippase
MFKKLVTHTSSILEATAVLAVASLVSRIFGLVRDRTLAAHFGAGDVMDAYFAAFKIPDFVFNLLILGALSSAFIPIFTEYLHRNGEDKEEAWGVVNSLINIGIVILAVVLLLAAIFAPMLAGIIAPGFDAEKQDLVIMLMRVMLLSPLFFGISNLAGGILNSFKNYLAYAVAPILYNLGIIVGVIWLVPQFGTIGLAYGVVLGAFLHMMIQLPGVFAYGFRYRLHLNWHHPALKKMAWLMLPRTLGIAVVQLNVVINTIIASTLAVGSVSVLNWADNLQSLPIGIFGVSFAVAVFPVLAEKYTLQKVDEFKSDFVKVFKQILFFIIPTMVLYWLLRAQIVRLVLGAGQFGWEETRFTISVLAFMTFGMIAQATIPLLARCFYALQDTKTPLITSLVALAVNVAMAFVLIPKLQVVGLGAALAISGLMNMILLLAVLNRKLGDLPWQQILNTVSKISAGAVIMGGVGYLMLRVMNLIIDTHTFWGLLAQTSVTIVVGVLAYLVIVKRLKVAEVAMVVHPVKTLWQRIRQR